ncbi:MAG: hypothetical protein KDB97_02740 [Flavobacteriales bacterium]|nr:hypothetical protein [Flavobacteriales bacterium]
MNNTCHRRWMIVLIIVIALCCATSAIYGLRAGHVARAIGTASAGLVFAILIGSRLQKQNKDPR